MFLTHCLFSLLFSRWCQLSKTLSWTRWVKLTLNLRPLTWPVVTWTRVTPRRWYLFCPQGQIPWMYSWNLLWKKVRKWHKLLAHNWKIICMQCCKWFCCHLEIIFSEMTNCSIWDWIQIYCTAYIIQISYKYRSGESRKHASFWGYLVQKFFLDNFFIMASEYDKKTLYSAVEDTLLSKPLKSIAAYSHSESAGDSNF